MTRVVHPASLIEKKNQPSVAHSYDSHFTLMVQVKFFKILDHSYGSHSPQSGGATYYASIGLSKNIIQALGRWTFHAWKDYIHDNPTIQA